MIIEYNRPSSKQGFKYIPTKATHFSSCVPIITRYETWRISQGRDFPSGWLPLNIGVLAHSESTRHTTIFLAEAIPICG